MQKWSGVKRSGIFAFRKKQGAGNFFVRKNAVQAYWTDKGGIDASKIPDNTIDITKLKLNNGVLEVSGNDH